MEYSTTIGVDVSDRTSKICVMRKNKSPHGLKCRAHWSIMNVPMVYVLFIPDPLQSLYHYSLSAD